MMQNIISVNGGTFRAGLLFSDNFDKDTTSRFVAKMFIFVLVLGNLILWNLQWRHRNPFE